MSSISLLREVAAAPLPSLMLQDYESFLTQNGLRVWPKDCREALAMRARLAQDDAPNLPPAPAGVVRLKGLGGLSEFVQQAAPELAANAMLCAVNQAAYLLKRQLESQGAEFLEKGGFTENLYGARSQKRKSDVSDKSDRFDKSDKPKCPKCGKAMVQRTARTGTKSGQQFWGCSAYPDCKGTLPSDGSCASDQSDKPRNETPCPPPTPAKRASKR